MRIRSFVFLVAAALVAGCAGSDSPSADVDTAAAEGPDGGASGGAATDATSAGEGGGDVSVGEADGAAGAAEDDAGAGAPREVVVAETGSLSGGAEVCQMAEGGGSCTGPGGVRDGFEIDLGGGAATKFELTLSWEPETPVSQMLSMSVFACDEEDCTIIDISGPSGITVARDDGPWTSLVVAVSAQPQGTAGVSVYAAAPEEFALDGLVTVVGP